MRDSLDFYATKLYHYEDMWDLQIANPFGRLSIRSVLMFVATTVVTILAFILLAAPTAHAADVVWNGDSITYAKNTYQKSADAKDGDGLNLPAGSHVYMYITSKDDSSNTSTQKAYVIYFGPKEDPAKTKSAKYAIYDFTPPSTYSNPTGQKTLSVEEKSADDSGTSCSIPGIGWMVCPVSKFMANSMDWMYSNVLTQFLAVRPVQSNTDNSLFKAWAIMRNFANVAFVMAFLVIIWSQVSSIGISNYGIKKMLPRLVVAAILVNISYWVCALAIDVSNILGYSINDLLMSVTKTVRGSGSDVRINWVDITTAILSGGTIAVAGITALVAIGSIGGAIAMLLPVLLGVLVAAIVAIVIMAARQAIIVILVIMAPLAFVAYLLPNTEKYFEKWKDLFITMLMMFPIFSVLFGGSQLAGTAIIQNADSIIMLILGMAVQVAPLVILPFVIKFSGSLLGRIAGMANNRSKGLVDRSRGFANDIADSRKAAVLARTKRRGLLTRTVQGVDNGRRKREGMKKANEALADARWEGHRNAARVHEVGARAALTKEAAEARSERHIEHLKHTNADMQTLDLQARAAKHEMELSKAKVETNWEQLKTGDTSDIVTPENLSSEALSHYIRRRDEMATKVKATSLEAAATGMRQDAAKHQQTHDVSSALLQNAVQVEGKTILEYAGGVQGAAGQEAALSKGVTAYRKQLQEGIENNLQLMKHFNISTEDKQKLALGEDLKATRPDGTKFTFSGENIHAREAAIDEILKTGGYSMIDEIIRESGVVKDKTTGEIIYKGKTADYADSISRAIKSAGVDQKALYWGSTIINDIGQGKISGEEGRSRAIVHHLEGGKIKADQLAGMDAGALQHLFDIAKDPSSYADYSENPTALAANSQALRKSVEEIIHTDLLNSRASTKALQYMQEFLDRPGS